MSVLSVRNLQTYFYTDEGVVKAVDGVSFDLQKGRTLCVVGESGCGKSVMSLSLMGLIPSPPGKIVGGEVIFKQQNVLNFNQAQMRQIRGNEMAMIFQEPMTSLNPVFTVGYQIMEAIQTHRKVSRQEARDRTLELLRLVGIPSVERRIDQYPHQMSGGMRQRIMIAMALACDPDVLIADEPTTALDVTIQAQILELLTRLQEELGMALLLITHDLGIVSEIADDVMVMYAGKAVEKAPVKELFANPLHPYTVGLLESLPSHHIPKGQRLKVIPGIVPSLAQLPVGCSFQDRCPWVVEKCRHEEPTLELKAEMHRVSCWEAQNALKTSSQTGESQ